MKTTVLITDVFSKGFGLQKLYSSARMWNHNQMSTSSLVFILLLIERKCRKSNRKCQAYCGGMKKSVDVLSASLDFVTCQWLRSECMQPSKIPMLELVG